jgi:hypothetical protein
MRYTIDRIEEGIAVLESPERKMRDVPLGDLPAGVCEGDAVEEENGVWRAVDNSAVREDVNARFARLVKKG